MNLQALRSRDAYRRLCDTEDTIPLFSQAWWLDAVAGDTWDAVLACQGEQVMGALPFVEKKRWGFTLVTQPKLTQSLGPWVRPTDKSYPKVLAYEKDVLGALADGLPSYHYYGQNWHFNQDNWLPFYWRRFNQTTRYTYVLPDISNLDNLWKEFTKDIRGNVRKARERFGLNVRLGDDVSELFPVLRKTFDRQNKKLPYSESFLKKVDEAASFKGQRAIILGEDAEGQLHAGTYIVWHGDTAYQLLNGYDPELRQSGAGSLCVWSAIMKASEHVDRYDFEGSMLEPVERFFRAFGARQAPYFHVSQTRSRALNMAMCLRSAAKEI